MRINMDGTTSKQKFGRPRHYDNGVYYVTSRTIPVMDEEDENPYVAVTRIKGHTVLLFNPELLESLRMAYDGLGVKLIWFNTSNPLDITEAIWKKDS